MNEHPEVRAKRLLREAGYNHIKVFMKNDVIHFNAKRFTRVILGVVIGNNIRVTLGANATHQIYFEARIPEEETIKEALQFAKRYYCLVKVSDYISYKESWHGLKYIKPNDRPQPRVINVLPTSKLEDILKLIKEDK